MAIRYRINENCVLCGACLPECPQEAITEGDPAYIIDPAKCDACGDCADICPTEACEQFDWGQPGIIALPPMGLFLDLKVEQ